MTREEIDLILTRKNDEILIAHKEIVDSQKGLGNAIKTGYEDLDYFLVGGLNNKMVFIGSRPSMGKTFHCETVINNLLNSAINPNQDISILRMNLEMQTKSLLLRDLKKSLGKKMIDIVSQPYSESEQEIVKKVVAKHRDKRVINFSRTVEGDELRYLISQYIALVDAADKQYFEDTGKVRTTQKIILVDHLHIYQTKKQIDDVLAILNEYKMIDRNLSFIIYFQFNRTLEEVWRDSKDKKANPKNFLPNSSHIYNTDSLMQYADIILGLVIPQVVDLDEFVSVYKDRNEHLKDHFVTGSDDNVTVRLKGRNRIYYNYIKIRLVDDFEDPRLYAQVLDPNAEESAEKIYLQNKSPFSLASTEIPVFNPIEIERKVEDIVKPPSFDSLGDVFDVPKVEDDSDAPF